MQGKVRSYFEEHAHNYPKDLNFYSSIVEHIKKNTPVDYSNIRFLDVGCGNGNFIKALDNAGIKADYFATDISFNMIKIAMKNLGGRTVKFFVADGFKIPLKPDSKFDVIHIDSVLHHLIGDNRRTSINQILKMIELLVSMLAKKGVLIVEEVFYNSYLIPRLTSWVVFYGLKIFKILNINAGRVIKEFKPGLEVNLLHEKQLLQMLRRYGICYSLNKRGWPVPRSYKFLLLKEFGHITVILKNNS